MAYMDSADLLARTKLLAGRDKLSSDASMTDANWYSFLSDAQLHWVRELAIHVPDLMYTQVKLATADAGVTYDFTTEPLGHYEVRESPTGVLWVPGNEWDPQADFVPSGNKIRFPGQKARTFTNGPWARYVPMPTVLDGSTPPSLSPTHTRTLLPYRACIIWASRGGLRDTKHFHDLEQAEWYGDPVTGRGGVLTALVTQAFLKGNTALNDNPGSWYPVTDGSGYTKYVP